MPCRVILFFLFSVSSTFGQIYFDHVPVNYQLIPRDLSTNTGTMKVDGYVSNAVYSSDSVIFEVYREEKCVKRNAQALKFDNHKAKFSYDLVIPAELANYSFLAYLKSGENKKSNYQVQKLVAGDVFVIQGQSNAMAKRRDEKAFEYESLFIRVFGCGSADPLLIERSQSWFPGRADASGDFKGNIGQWGTYFARRLLDSLGIPIAIFNGASGGKSIDTFLPTDDYKTSDNSNYGRLYRRLDAAGVRDHVRAIFWSQGEEDGNYRIKTSTNDYKAHFLELKNQWQNDFSGLERIYIFQTKPGCGDSLGHVMPIIEAQRQLAFEDQMVNIIPTSGIPHYSDKCHFNFVNGYKVFGERLFDLVIADLYSGESKGLIPIRIPEVISVDLNKNLILIRSNTSIEIEGNVFGFQVHNSEGLRIESIKATGNQIEIELNEIPNGSIYLSYVGEPEDAMGFIGSNGIELVSFYKIAVMKKG